jgi:membrane dipeptidase
VAGAGGIVRAWTDLADTVVEYVQNIQALIDVIGIDHVGIGTDTKLTPASGGGRGSGGGARIGDRTNQVWQGQEVDFYYVVVDAILKAGFNREDIRKVGGGNFLRVFDAATVSKR